MVLEDTVELQCSAPDCLALRTSESVRLRDLVKASLRTSPDRIVVGEVRDEAALDLLDAWQTGHPGGVATVHANDPLSALHRLDRLAQRANAGPQGQLVGDAIHPVVMISGGSAGRAGGGPLRAGAADRVAGAGGGPGAASPKCRGIVFRSWLTSTLPASAAAAKTSLSGRAANPASAALRKSTAGSWRATAKRITSLRSASA